MMKKYSKEKIKEEKEILGEGLSSRNNNKCYYHPKQDLIGICPLCLNQRLLILAAKQDYSSKNFLQHSSSNNKKNTSTTSTCKRKVSSALLSLPFRSFFYFRYKRPRPRPHPHPHPHPPPLDSTCSTSFQDDSFISIKFEDNGVATWDKRGSKSVVEHAKPRPVSLRLRKRIAQLLHLIKWKKGSIQPRNVGGTDSRDRSWIRTLNITTKD